MVEVAKKLVEAVIGWKVFVSVPEMVFTELAGDIPLSLEQSSDRWIFLLHTKFRTR